MFMEFTETPKKVIPLITIEAVYFICFFFIVLKPVTSPTTENSGAQQLSYAEYCVVTGLPKNILRHRKN